MNREGVNGAHLHLHVLLIDTHPGAPKSLYIDGGERSVSSCSYLGEFEVSIFDFFEKLVVDGNRINQLIGLHKLILCLVDTIPTLRELIDLDLLDPAIMGNEKSLYELLGYLREDDPVSYVEHPDYDPFWAITRHEDIKFISQNNARFLNNPRTVLVQREFEEALLKQFGSRNGLDTLIHMDAPRHKQLRGVTAQQREDGRGHRDAQIRHPEKEHARRLVRPEWRLVEYIARDAVPPPTSADWVSVSSCRP